MSVVRAGRDIFDAARELDFRSIQQEVTRFVRVLVAGRDDLSNREVTRQAFGPPELVCADGSIELLTLTPEVRPSVSAVIDLALVVIPLGAEPDSVDIMLIAALRAYAVPTIVIELESRPRPHANDAPSHWLLDVPSKRQIHASLAHRGHLVHGLSRALATLDRHKLPPLAHRFLPLRPVVVELLIRDSSKVNGEFALLSNLPALVPLVGGVVSNLADLLVLTKNQVTLVFRIAGIYNRDLSDRTAVLLEITPVVGGAFLWRTAARSLVSMLPLGISAVPKTLVAYVGTYVVGQIAHYYYREGRRPSPEKLDEIRRQGLQLARRIFNRE